MLASAARISLSSAADVRAAGPPEYVNHSYNTDSVSDGGKLNVLIKTSQVKKKHIPYSEDHSEMRCSAVSSTRISC